MSAAIGGLHAAMLKSIEQLTLEMIALDSTEDEAAEVGQRAKVAMMAEAAAEYFLQVRHVALFRKSARGLHLESVTDAEADAIAGAWKFARASVPA